ncbi:Polyphosphatidylinositol phosphatase INP52 [Spathaspora sp. JA1]|nr:Polyphosphatidylinositol phosphatase INP52 [Spathaspora sp. JA1]
MRLLYKENPRTIAIHSNTHTLTFRAQSSSGETKKPLVNLELVPNSHITKNQGYRSLLAKDIYGCLGLIHIDNQIYIAIISGAIVNVANPTHNETVDRIYSIELISLEDNYWDHKLLDSNGFAVISADDPDSQEEAGLRIQHPCIDIKKLVSNGSFYYSNDFDLTSLLQNRGVNFEPGARSIDHYSKEYMWNSFLMEEILKYRANLDQQSQLILDENKFLTVAIRGFAKTVQLGGHDSITVISKQSWKRAGTRYNTRGIDDDGNVANYVETEFIYFNPSHNSIFSFVQIRGSVPTFWEQDSTLINPKITVTRSNEATQPIFNAHFKQICENYGVTHIVDLLSTSKPAEVQLSNRYKQLYQQCDRNNEIEYTAFDFHQETKVGGFIQAEKIIPLLQESIEQFGWFYYDLNAREIITRQDGIFRVNCLDCLDRTNLIQQIICRNILQNILSNIGSRQRNEESLMVRYNSLWADNGDAISQIYTGTNALKSSFSRSGKMNFAGALSDVTKSVSRMYQNTFVDSKKQSTIDLLLGVDGKLSKSVKIYDPLHQFINGKLKQRSGSFTSFKNIKCFTGTYNVNALEPEQHIDLSSWLFPSGMSPADIYCIGFQELIDLNPQSILNADMTKANKWATILNRELNNNPEQQYVLLRVESIASMSLFLFVNKSQVSYVTQVSGSSKKTGLGGMTANKGACAVRFNFGDTSFAMITCHLAAGMQATLERYNDYSTILQGLLFPRNYSIRDHDHIIWFGDLNYRINLPNDKCRDLIFQGAYNELIQADQLNDEKRNGGAFKQFNEGVITFPPTYKYDKGTSNYDSSEKQRVPSWTDRVLFTSSTGLSQDLTLLKYDSVTDLVLSDHKPVYGVFDIKVDFINRERKAQISKELYNVYKKEHGGELVSLSDTASVVSSSAGFSDFSTDALSELNLLDDDIDMAPKLPQRPTSRKAPPPPTSRKVTPSASSPRRLPPPATPSPAPASAAASTASPAPPPPLPRRVPPVVSASATASPSMSPSLQNVPIGFSSAPLIPTRSNTANSLSPNLTPVNSTTSLPTKTEQKQHVFKPLVPTKPQALASSKLTPEKSPEEEKEQTTTSTSTPPPPPAPRQVASVGMSMSDWKPLIPQ